jgi:hypothetical protein
MKTRILQSWQLFKTSIDVTFRYPKLLCFPAITTVLTLLIALFFLTAIAIPFALQDTGYRLNQKQHWETVLERNFPGTIGPKKSGIVTDSSVQSQAGQATANHAQATGAPLIMVPIYFISMFLATFFNVAFYNEILMALDGRGVSFRRGLQAAWQRVGAILAWSLLAGVVGWLIRALQERLPFVGRIITGIIGLVWSVAAVFAIPVIVQDPGTRNPLLILQRSASALKRTWGEGLIGYVGLSVGNVLVVLGSLVFLGVVCVAAYLTGSVLLVFVAAGFWLIGLVLLAYVMSVAGHVFRCALFKYATEGAIPAPYTQDMLDRAWKVKR